MTLPDFFQMDLRLELSLRVYLVRRRAQPHQPSNIEFYIYQYDQRPTRGSLGYLLPERGISGHGGFGLALLLTAVRGV